MTKMTKITKRLFLSVIVTIGLFILAGCPGAPAPIQQPQPEPADTYHPSVSNPRLSFDTQSGTHLIIPAGGGQIRVDATVTDPSGVDLVELRVFPEVSGTPQRLTLTADNRVSSTVSIPFNATPFNQDYGFSLFVQDRVGNKAIVSIGVVTVQSPLSGIAPLPSPGGIPWQ